MTEFERCLEERRIIRVEATYKMIGKELDGAIYDLRSAEESSHTGDYKWASIQAYYSMFHAAKALVLKKGYREKSHYCLLVALRELYIKSKELGQELADSFELAMDSRHEADYALMFDEDSAKIAIENAKIFLRKTQELLKNG
jgi:uncharacterized protein (UPF0332 family)